MAITSRFSKRLKEALHDAKFVAADTLSGDKNSSDPIDGIQYRSVPQVSDHSDINPNPNSQQKQQDMEHGEPDLGFIQKNIGNEQISYPNQGDVNPDREKLLINFPSDRNAQQRGKDQGWFNRFFHGSVSFDGFMHMLGNGDYLTQKHIDSVQPQLLEVLQNAGAISKIPIYKVDNARLKELSEALVKNGRDLSKISIGEISKYLKDIGTKVSDINVPTFAKPQQKNVDEKNVNVAPEVDSENESIIDSKLKMIFSKFPQSMHSLPLLQLVPTSVRQSANADMRAELIFDLISRYSPSMTLMQFYGLDMKLLQDWWNKDQQQVKAKRRAQLDKKQKEQRFAEIAEKLKTSHNFTEEDAKWLNSYGLMQEFMDYLQKPGMSEQKNVQQNVQQIENVNVGKNNFPFDESQLSIFKENILRYILEAYEAKHPQKKSGRAKMSRLSVSDVRNISPRFANKMEKLGISWVEEKPFMDALAEFNKTRIEIALNPCKFVFYHRRNGIALNTIKQALSNKLIEKNIDQQTHDLSCVFMDKMAQLDMTGKLLSYDEIKSKVNAHVDFESTKSLTTPINFVREAAKEIKAKDYTLYHMDMGTDLDRFNYNDSWDIDWVLYRQTKEGKKGSKIDVYPSPGRCLYRMVEHGDGDYLCIGTTKLDDSYWGTYSIKVSQGIVVQYAKVPVDKEGKRYASIADSGRMVSAKIARETAYRSSKALYKALKKHLAQSGIKAPMFEDFPSDDDELTRRMQKMQEWYDKKDKENKSIDNQISSLKPAVPDSVEAIPSQEEFDQKYDQYLQQLKTTEPDLFR